MGSNSIIALSIDNDAWFDWLKQDEWQGKIRKIVNQTFIGANWDCVTEVSFLLTDDNNSQQLNYIHRHKNYPTNVLSFPAFTPKELAVLTKKQGGVFIGDIMLSLETCLRESKEQNKLFLNHFTHLVVHGVLHLLGYDHETDEQAEQMEGMEVEILSLLSISNPYV